MLIPPVCRIEPAWSGLPADRVSAVSGRAVSDSRRISSGGYLFELEAARVFASDGSEADAGGRVLMFFDTDPRLRRGRMLTVRTGLSCGEPAIVPTLRKNAVFTAYPDHDSISRGGWNSPLAEFRARLIDSIAAKCRSMGGGPGGLFAALFYGSRDGLTLSETDIFRRAGCSHILALSGMHLGILSAVLLLLLKPLPWKKAVYLISCGVILFYLYLTGFGISLVRAAVMYAVAGAAAAFYRKYRAFDVLMLSFVIVVLIAPESFYTAAFRLSFLAVAGIILMTPHISMLLRRFLPRSLSLALAASLAAQLFVSPLLAAMFGALYPAGLAAGLIEAPMVTVFIWIGIIYLVTGWGPAAWCADILYRAIFFTAGKAAALPAIKTGAAVPVAGVCAALCLICIAISYNKRKLNGISGKL